VRAYEINKRASATCSSSIDLDCGWRSIHVCYGWDRAALLSDSK